MADREIVVVAGAGTGKTHTLAMRYTTLLLSLANAGERDVERVLLLTFTDKAAAEMADRCHKQPGLLCRAARALLPAPSVRPDAAGARLLRIVESLDAMADNFERARISGEEVPERADEAPLADASIETEQRDRATRALVLALPERQRAAIVLTYYEELPNAEAAEAMDMNIKAFESLLHRARASLRQAFAAQGQAQ